MAGDEYTAAVGGGALKLKGAKNAGVDKKRKKSKSSKSKLSETADLLSSKPDAPLNKDEELDLVKDDDAVELRAPPKTEAERRHEETRKKRLDERLKREGLKTHKERVEELNKYLSTLSEHHDMPRIGPG